MFVLRTYFKIFGDVNFLVIALTTDNTLFSASIHFNIAFVYTYLDILVNGIHKS